MDNRREGGTAPAGRDTFGDMTLDGGRSDSPGSADEFVIRPATADDARGLAEAHIASWRVAYRGLLPQSVLDGLSVDERTTRWEHSLEAGDDDVRVAADASGNIGGFVATCPSRDDDATDTVGELRAIYLRGDLWGQGVGRRLHGAGIQALSGRFDEATLWVLDGNARARGFYERQGWRADGARKRLAIQEADVGEVRYRRAL